MHIQTLSLLLALPCTTHLTNGKMLDYGSHFLDLVACLIMEGKDLKIEKIGGLMLGLATTGSLIGAEDKVIMSVF